MKYYNKLCKCGCGNKIKAKEHHKQKGVPDFLPYHYSKVKTLEHREKLSKTIKHIYNLGNAKFGFKKGIIPVNKKYFDDRNAYTRIAFSNLSRKCNKCKNKDVRVLIVHHKDKNRKNNKLENLEILCQNCHAIEHYKEQNLGRYRK